MLIFTVVRIHASIIWMTESCSTVCKENKVSDINQAFRINQNRKLSSIYAELSVWQDIESSLSLSPCSESLHECMKTGSSFPARPQTFPKLSIVY